MALFPSLPEIPHLGDVFKRFPKGLIHLLEYHDVFLREESELSMAERELIAAYVSGLNQCKFCQAAHDLMSRAYGVDENLLEDLHNDLESAGVSEKIRPVLRYVRKLTDVPIKLVSADAQAVYDAGWSEEALYDAIAICALFNFMNRIVEGTGVIPGQGYFEPTEEELARRRGGTYMEWGRSAGLIDKSQ
ncbi:peroxidase-related enzyme [bacterium AH-315-P15]|nr:peroxidase-related enzyme [bacterium AH-315-P15]